jgi:group I intron endonuclease
MGWIYMLKNKMNGKKYIGQTSQTIEERLKQHRKKNNSCRRLCYAIQRYGWDNFEIEWYECPDEDLNEHEEFAIEVIGTLSPNGYNLTQGGSRGKDSDETKQKKRDSRLGKTHSKETKQKQSKTMTGEHNPMYGKNGEKHHNSKRVYQYDLDGNFIDSFGSTGEAARILKLKESGSGGIRTCARGKYKNAYNFKWSYTLDIFM